MAKPSVLRALKDLCGTWLERRERRSLSGARSWACGAPERVNRAVWERQRQQAIVQVAPGEVGQR
jgi:hypothetical protein